MGHHHLHGYLDHKSDFDLFGLPDFVFERQNVLPIFWPERRFKLGAADCRPHRDHPPPVGRVLFNGLDGIRFSWWDGDKVEWRRATPVPNFTSKGALQVQLSSVSCPIKCRTL